MIDLKPKYQTILRKIFSTHIPDKIVWAYGSRVKGKAHEGSDLDLVIKDPNNQAIPSQTLYALQDAVQESNLPILVDILDWSQLNEDFRKEISSQYEVFDIHLNQ